MANSEQSSTEKWWVETEAGDVLFGPCAGRDMAISVRSVIESWHAPQTFWVRHNDQREGWVVFAQPVGIRST